MPRSRHCAELARLLSEIWWLTELGTASIQMHLSWDLLGVLLRTSGPPCFSINSTALLRCSTTITAQSISLSLARPILLIEPGKDLIAEIIAFSRSASSNGRFTYILGYDMAIARSMYAGCDIWLNTPVRTREASGTSGEKAALNGGLNCSILDGWWDEMYDEQHGWSIPTSENLDPHRRDIVESAATLDTLDQIIDEYYGRRDEFIGRNRRSWTYLGPWVVAARMLRDYQDRLYGPALERTRRNVTESAQGRLEDEV